MTLAAVVRWAERHQVPLYLLALAIGAAVGLLVPQAAPVAGHAIEPALLLLLFATFLGIPLVGLGRALRDIRFLGIVLAVNFLLVPVIAGALSRFVADDSGLLFGVLLVLLTPCIDYVVVFTGLAGGARERLLATTPLLMLAQILLLPLFLVLFAGGGAVTAIDPLPFVRAFLVLIVVPLAAAGVVQALARRHRSAQRVAEGSTAVMVPLMMVVLAVVVASQIAAVGQQFPALLRVVPIYIAFVVLAVAAGMVAAKAGRLDVPAARAVVFSAATRNSLVVLPLALALPNSMGLAPLAVVTQTLVELLAMVVLVRLVPKLVREPGYRTS